MTRSEKRAWAERDYSEYWMQASPLRHLENKAYGDFTRQDWGNYLFAYEPSYRRRDRWRMTGRYLIYPLRHIRAQAGDVHWELRTDTYVCVVRPGFRSVAAYRITGQLARAFAKDCDDMPVHDFIRELTRHTRQLEITQGVVLP